MALFSIYPRPSRRELAMAYMLPDKGAQDMGPIPADATVSELIAAVCEDDRTVAGDLIRFPEGTVLVIYPPMSA